MASSATEKVAVIKECLAYKDPTGVKKLILEDKFKDDGYFWELVTLLGACLTEENLQQCPGFFEVCERCINYIVKVGNASELILALLEQADSFDDTVKFQSFLEIIQKALLLVKTRQQFSLEISIETLSDCIKNLEAPKSLDLEGEERRAHDLDPNVDKINKYVIAYLEFLKPFVEQVASGKKETFKGENFTRQVDCLLRCLMQVLDHPLVLLDLTMKHAEDDAQKIKSDSRIGAERLIQQLATMYPNLNNLIKTLIEHNDKIRRMERSKKKNNDSKDVNGVDGASASAHEPVPELGLSCLVYLVHHDPMWNTQAGVGPSLHVPQGIMEADLPYILVLLRRKQSEVCRKGVLLFQTLIAMQNDTTLLTCVDLDRPEYFDILDTMFDIMIHCSVKEIRQDCLKLLPEFMALFDLEARYRIFFKVFATQKHPGAYGFFVQLFKTQLDEILKTADVSETQSSQFCNVGLHRIFNLITSLSDGAATDFVENSDRIIAVLNLLRYIILRDPPSANQTGFWDFQEKVQKNFLSELQTGLEMSKAHYQLELTGLQEGGDAKNQSDDKQEVEMSMCVAGFKLPKMERGQKEGILRQALNTLDLIASLLARLGELTDQQKRLAKTQ